MVELGDGRRFFFDFGSGCCRNIFAMQVPFLNDIFLTHLHVDHFADLPYLYVFAPWMARWKPLRVHGPSGRIPKDGTKAMIEAMQAMCYWHTDSFNSFPIGDGYEVEVNEFDFRDDNGVCCDKDGCTVRHWRRSHTKDGASAYRLEWKGLSFVWTGDGRPDALTAKLAKGVDVFVTETQPDLANLTTFGLPPIMTTSRSTRRIRLTTPPVICSSRSIHAWRWLRTLACGQLHHQAAPRASIIWHSLPVDFPRHPNDDIDWLAKLT
jgi:hypothetical protein